MKIEEIHIGPITTPDCPDPTESPRYIRDDYGFCGFDTVFLEDAIWNAKLPARKAAPSTSCAATSN
jgi:hypothetical protein